MKTFVIGDIHGAHAALKQCLDRSGFDKDSDRLICLGDIVDGFPGVKECVQELLGIKNCFMCLGNHDYWALDFFNRGVVESYWLKQGGQATVDSYGTIMKPEIPEEHLKFLNNWFPFIVIGEGDKEQLFVHGGINLQKSVESHDIDDLIWDRQMLETCWKKTIRGQKYKVQGFQDIFVGHTTTQCFGIWDADQGCISERRPTVPLHLCNVWMLDTGAGWDGKLTIMDVDSKQYWQSDPVLNLYPNMGRGLRF